MNKRKKMDKTMDITKYNIFMWSIRNVIKIFSVSFVLVVVVMLVIYLFAHAESVPVTGLFPFFGMLLAAFIIITLGPGSFHSYVALFLLHRQEKYLHVNMEKELAGKKMKGSSYEAMYQDENWFICYGGSYVNVYHKKYIEEILELQKTTYLRKISVSSVDGNDSTFVLSNMYGKNFPKFKAWCKKKGSTETKK